MTFFRPLHRRCIAASCLVLILCALTLHAQPATQPATTDPALDSLLHEIDARAAKVTDLSAHFQQSKYTALMKKPLISTGIIRAAGPVTRWDTQSPHLTVLYADAQTLRLYYPDQKLEEIYPIDQRLGDLLTSPLPRFATLSKHFTIARAAPTDLADLPPADAQTLVVHLTPSDPMLQQHVQSVIVVLNPKSALAIAVKMIDSDGDRTIMVFSEIKQNTGLKPADLVLNVPADTTLSHPLEGLH